jgi:hypothetical protein
VDLSEIPVQANKVAGLKFKIAAKKMREFMGRLFISENYLAEHFMSKETIKSRGHVGKVTWGHGEIQRQMRVSKRASAVDQTFTSF